MTSRGLGGWSGAGPWRCGDLWFVGAAAVLEGFGDGWRGVERPAESSSALLVCDVRRVDAAASEGVEVSPPAGDVEQLQVADGHRKGGVDDEVLADRFEPEHRSEQQKRCAGGPRLGAAGGGVLHRVLRHGSRVAAECFGEPAVEERRSLEDALRRRELLRP